MCPQSAALPADIGFQCTNEELCSSLGKIISGSPLPGNVIEDANPYQLVPSDLPGTFQIFEAINPSMWYGEYPYFDLIKLIS